METLHKSNVARVPIIQVETAGGEGSTGPLHDAAKRGNLELVRECLRFLWLYYFHHYTNIFCCRSNRMPVNQTDPAGNTPLHWAARAGQLDCVAELVAVNQIGLNKVKNNIYSNKNILILDLKIFVYPGKQAGRHASAARRPARTRGLCRDSA